MKSIIFALAALLALVTGATPVLPSVHAHADSQVAWCSCG